MAKKYKPTRDDTVRTDHGCYNIAIGYPAGVQAPPNTFFGYNSGYTSASNCITIGRSALMGTTKNTLPPDPPFFPSGCNCADCHASAHKMDQGEGCYCKAVGGGTCDTCKVVDHVCHTEPGFHTCTFCGKTVSDEFEPRPTNFRKIGANNLYVYWPHKFPTGCVYGPAQKCLEKYEEVTVLPFKFDHPLSVNTIHDSILSMRDYLDVLAPSSRDRNAPHFKNSIPKGFA